MKRIEISNNTKCLILKLKSEGKSYRKISESVGFSTSLIDRVIKERIVSNRDFDNLIAICKKTGKSFSDVTNSSGSITTHLNEVYPNIKPPSNYIKRKYKKENQRMELASRKI